LVTLDLGREGEREGALDAVRIVTGAERSPAVPLVGWKQGEPTFRLEDKDLESLGCVTLLVESEDVPEELREFAIDPGALGEDAEDAGEAGDGASDESPKKEEAP
jgi:hypothetical protein